MAIPDQIKLHDKPSHFQTPEGPEVDLWKTSYSRRGLWASGIGSGIGSPILKADSEEVPREQV